MPRAPHFAWSGMEKRNAGRHSELAGVGRKPRGCLCWCGGEKGSWDCFSEWSGREMVVPGCPLGYWSESWESQGRPAERRRSVGSPAGCRCS